MSLRASFSFSSLLFLTLTFAFSRRVTLDLFFGPIRSVEREYEKCFISNILLQDVYNLYLVYIVYI